MSGRRNSSGNTNRKPEAPTTRDRILHAAADVLSRKGYSETRLGDIAAAARLRAPAVYYYFESRESLISEVMALGQRLLREHVESALAALTDEASAMDRICTAVQAHLQVELQLSSFATAVTRNRGQLPDDVRDTLRAESSAYIELWRGLLDQARAVGAIRDELDLRAARMLIMGALNWTPEWWSPYHGPLNGVVETAQKLVRHGLGTDPPQQHIF